VLVHLLVGRSALTGALGSVGKVRSPDVCLGHSYMFFLPGLKVLAEIPDQLLGYMKCKNFKPGKKNI
jgi:hypothetical protein